MATPLGKNRRASDRKMLLTDDKRSILLASGVPKKAYARELASKENAIG